jgi:hypothetical protein
MAARFCALLSLIFFPCALIACEKSQHAVHRVLETRQLCMPCGNRSPVLIDSYERLQELYLILLETCKPPSAADRWRDAVLATGADLRVEAVVVLYEVIGTGGTASLDITGSSEGVLNAAVRWQTGGPPHVPIASAACLSFAVLKSAVRKVNVHTGGVLAASGGVSLIIGVTSENGKKSCSKLLEYPNKKSGF